MQLRRGGAEAGVSGSKFFAGGIIERIAGKQWTFGYNNSNSAEYCWKIWGLTINDCGELCYF